MKKTSKKKKQLPFAGFRPYLSAAGVLLALAAFVILAVLGMFRTVNGMALSASRQTMLENARHDRAAMQAVFAQREQTLERWAYSLRNVGFTDSSELLRSVAQDGPLLGAGELYLVDDVFLYYGSDGLTRSLPQYDALLSSQSPQTQTRRVGSRILVSVQVRPFTVDGSTFRWAAALYESEEYLSDLSRGMLTGTNGAQIVDADGTPIFRMGMENSLFSMLDSAQTEGYASPSDLKQAVLTAEALYTACRFGSEERILLSGKLPDTEWILLTLEPAPTLPSPLSPMMGLYLAAVLLLAGAVWRMRGLRLREKSLSRQAKEALSSREQLQASLDAAMETNRSQMAFLDTISHNIRTPLNTIVGFTALATRHFQEPEVVREHLSKVGDASAQLLSKLNEGLDASGWHRYVEEDVQIPETVKPIDLRGKRILLVEDNALNRDIGEAVLSEIGIIVECAVNGQEGFQRIATSRPGYYDLVLMDIQMPVMDGYEATRMIRHLRSKLLAEIPILAMTANVAVEDKRVAFEAGMDGYVEKPMNMDKLLEAIRSALSRGIEI